MLKLNAFLKEKNVDFLSKEKKKNLSCSNGTILYLLEKCLFSRNL